MSYPIYSVTTQTDTKGQAPERRGIVKNKSADKTEKERVERVRAELIKKEYIVLNQILVALQPFDSDSQYKLLKASAEFLGLRINHDY